MGCAWCESLRIECTVGQRMAEQQSTPSSEMSEMDMENNGGPRCSTMRYRVYVSFNPCLEGRSNPHFESQLRPQQPFRLAHDAQLPDALA
jgi:hypothetical protein